MMTIDQKTVANNAPIPREICLKSVNLEPFLKFRRNQGCIEQAMRKPLPGNSADAFLKGSTKVGDVSVSQVMPIHIKCLQALESPILKMVDKARASDDGKASEDFTDEQQWEMCYIFCSNPKSLRVEFKDGGHEQIKSSAEEFCSDWTAAQIQGCVIAIMEQFHRHVKTTVKFMSEVEAQGDASFFQALRENLSKPAASAGS